MANRQGEGKPAAIILGGNLKTFSKCQKLLLKEEKKPEK